MVGKVIVVSVRRSISIVLTLVALGVVAHGQEVKKAETTQAPATTQVDRASSGDAPDDPGPLATDLSPAISHADIRKAAKKVADWELAHSVPQFNQQWTFAALYDGLLALSRTTGDARYHDAVLTMAQRYQWTLLDARFPHADDMALGQAYLDLFADNRDPVRQASTKATLDRLLTRPDDPAKLLWWWCDALFMAPPVLAKMSAITGDKRYLDYMDKEWWETSASLYDPTEHLYFRDSRYFTQKQANGQKLFWARGNGWVMGAFVKVLTSMPKDYPSRAKYIAQYKQMAERIASIQGNDGLWRSGLLDPEAYDLPEVSGSAFFTYSIAWGINQGILDRAKYQPVVEKAWAGMLTHIYADGRLGSIQPIDGAPGKFKASASYVYGVGGFLLAASEVDAMASHRAAQLRSPWDDARVQLTSAPYTCPAAISVPHTLSFEGFYRLDDPTHSIVDPVRQAAYNKAAKGVKDAGESIVAAADNFRTTGSRAAAQCTFALIGGLADADSMTGKMSSHQAEYVQGWVAGAIAIAALKVRGYGLETPERDASIAAWLKRIALHTESTYAVKTRDDGNRNNHFYWAGIEVVAIGVLANDRDAFDWGIRTYYDGVDRIQSDGTLPLEMKRASRALHYHLYALAPLVLLAEFGEANGMDLYARNNGALHRLVKLSVQGLVDPSYFERATGHKQEADAVPSGDQIGWAPPYLRRFPNPTLKSFVQNAKTLSVYYLGGLPPA